MPPGRAGTYLPMEWSEWEKGTGTLDFTAGSTYLDSTNNPARLVEA